MTEVASGSSVGRRLNELQNALDIAPPPVTSSSQAPDNNDDQFDEDYDGEETFEDVTDTMNDHEETKPSKIALGETPVTLAPKCNAAAKEGDGTARAATPTTPTNTSSSQSSLLASSTSTAYCSAQNTPTSAPCYMDETMNAVPPLPPLPEPLQNPSRASVSTLSSVSTPDVDRFSTVPLKTPTSTSVRNEDRFPSYANGLPPLNIGTTNGGSTITPLQDDEQDLGTAGLSTRLYDDHVAAPSSSVQKEDLKIRTDLEKDREDTLRTPVAGSSASSRSKRGSINPSTKPLAEGVDLLLARMEKDKADPRAARRSIEGREKLKEGFDRLHVSPNSAAFPKSPSRKIGGANGFPGGGPDEKIDWDFWGDVIANYEHVARTKSEQLASAIQKGIPSALRGMVWQLMSASKDTELERIYATLLKQSSPHEKAIVRDLGRTFPQHSFFMDGQGIGQENLFNVLKAYSLYDTEVGYCQGLAFIGAALLLNMPDEEAFCVLVRLMYSYGSRDMYLPEMPGLQLRLFQFDRLVEELLPVLHVHFLRQGIKSSMFCSQWFLTMFSYRFPLDLVFRIFDSVFGHGIEAIFGFSTVLLIKNEEKLLKLKFDQILEYMKGELFDLYRIDGPEGEPTDRTTESRFRYRADDFVVDAFRVKITPFMLDTYANEYNELRRVQTAHAMEMDNLRTANRGLANQVRELETSLSTLNAEHCEIVKQLVMAKIEREEIEAELVRYKLMYAEVMHDKEDSMSSHRMSQSPTPAGSGRGSSISSFSFPKLGRS